MEQGTNQLQHYLDSGIPDEFALIAKSYVEEITNEINIHKENAIKEFNELKDIPTNELYKYYNSHSNMYQHCIYSLRNGKDITKNIIKMVEPEVQMGDFLH